MKRDLRFRSTCREQQSNKTDHAGQQEQQQQQQHHHHGLPLLPSLAFDSKTSSPVPSLSPFLFPPLSPPLPSAFSLPAPPAPPSPPSAAGGRASMKKAQGAVVFRTDDPLAGRDYRPAMPGDNPDFWEGSQWDLLGFAAEYLWVFGIVLAVSTESYCVGPIPSNALLVPQV
ncbi:unnamed protein product [Closterium sp. NIES-53]